MLYDEMSDHEKKSFVRSIIESIELFPDRQRKKGCPIKWVQFKFPVAYNGESVYSLSPKRATDETVVLMSKVKEYGGLKRLEIKVFRGYCP